MDIQEIRRQVREYIAESPFNESEWDVDYAVDIIDNALDKCGAKTISEELMTLALEAAENKMEDYKETLSSAISEAEYYSTDANAIYGAEITGVVTEKTFTPEQIAKYDLPEFMAWNTGTRAEYDVSDHEYIGFDSIEEMADYIEEKSPLPEDEE